MISVFVVTYNEERILPYFVRWYRERFPGCTICVCDNESTDSTLAIAMDKGCLVHTFRTNKTFDDTWNIHIKNTIWRGAATDWVLCCDADEFLDIDEEALTREEKAGTTVVRTTGYDMVNMVDGFDYTSVHKGVRDDNYDKSLLFDRRHVTAINHEYGAHQSHPTGHVRYNVAAYLLRHYRYMDVEYAVARTKELGARLSNNNRALGLGLHYLDSEAAVREKFAQMRANARLLP